MFGIIKKMFIVVLSKISNHTKCVLLNKQKCEIQPTLILIYILMNTVKNFTTTLFRLN